MKISEMGNGNWWNNPPADIHDKRAFKRDELEWELRHEKDTVERGPFYVYSGKDSNSKRLIKAKDGVPFRFSTKQAAHKAVDKMRAKPFNKDKQFWISTKMEEAGKYGNPEKGVQVRTTQKPKKHKPVTGHQSPHPLQGKLVGEADEPKDKSARAKLDLNLRDRGHKVEKDKKKALRKGEVKHKKSLYQEMMDLEEGPLVVSNQTDLFRIIDTILDRWKSDKHSNEEVAELLKALGYKVEFDGPRAELIKEGYDPALIKMLADYEDNCEEYRYYGDTDVVTIDQLLKQGRKEDAAEEMAGAMSDQDGGSDKFDHMYDMALDAIEDYMLGEGNGNIRKGLAAVAMIAALWGVNDNMAQKAYDSSPQLQKLTAYLEVAKQHNDQRMIDQLEQRIENHKLRIDLGKGEVMGKDGRPVKVVYDKDAVDEETKKDACYHKVKRRYKVWPSAYASGALVQCRKKGAKNWGNKSKK